MRAVCAVAGTAAVIFGLGVLPGLAADLRPPAPPVVQYDDDDLDTALEPDMAPVAVAPLPPAPVGPPVYAFRGYDYCWFETGWNGSGWYVCDRGPWVRGAWWGGPAGWNGWAWRGGPRYYDRGFGHPRIGYGPPRGYARGYDGYDGYRDRGHWGRHYR